MEEITMQFWRVRNYNSEGRITHSFRVIGTDRPEVVSKVEEFLRAQGITPDAQARPAGNMQVWQ